MKLIMESWKKFLKEEAGETYVIRQGDNLSKIARRYGISLRQLLQLNPEYQKNPNYIRPGWEVKVPPGQKQDLSGKGANKPVEVPKDPSATKTRINAEELLNKNNANLRQEIVGILVADNMGFSEEDLEELKRNTFPSFRRSYAPTFIRSNLILKSALKLVLKLNLDSNVLLKSKTFQKEVNEPFENTMSDMRETVEASLNKKQTGSTVGTLSLVKQLGGQSAELEKYYTLKFKLIEKTLNGIMQSFNTGKGLETALKKIKDNVESIVQKRLHSTPRQVVTDREKENKRAYTAYSQRKIPVYNPRQIPDISTVADPDVRAIDKVIRKIRSEVAG